MVASLKISQKSKIKSLKACKILKKILEDFEPKATHKKTEAMKKNIYQKPAMRVVKIQHQQHLLAGSVRTLSTNLDDDDEIEYTGTISEKISNE